jgi:hypothetical protein
MTPRTRTAGTSTRSKRCVHTLSSPAHITQANVSLRLLQCQLNHNSLSHLKQTLESYDADSYKTVDLLLSLPTCTGRIGSTGMCLGGHLAVRAAVRKSLPLPPSSVSLQTRILTHKKTARPPHNRKRSLLRNRHPLPHIRPSHSRKHLPRSPLRFLSTHPRQPTPHDQEQLRGKLHLWRQGHPRPR